MALDLWSRGETGLVSARGMLAIRLVVNWFVPYSLVLIYTLIRPYIRALSIIKLTVLGLVLDLASAAFEPASS